MAETTKAQVNNENQYGSTWLHQEDFRPPPYSGLTSQSLVQYQAGTQIIYVHAVPPVSHVYKDYNGKLSVTFGVINILLVTIAIILNGFAFVRQAGRWSYDSIGNFMFFAYPSTYCGLFIYITAAFAIASGKKKHRCLIIAHLVLSIMGIISSFSFVGVSIYTFWLEVIARDDNVCFAIAIVWIPLSIIMFITVTWGSGLCCKVVCCRSSRVNISPVMVGGRQLNSTMDIGSDTILYTSPRR